MSEKLKGRSNPSSHKIKGLRKSNYFYSSLFSSIIGHFIQVYIFLYTSYPYFCLSIVFNFRITTELNIFKSCHEGMLQYHMHSIMPMQF